MTPSWDAIYSQLDAAEIPADFLEEETKMKFPVMVHFLSAIAAVVFIGAVLAVTHPHSFLTVFLIYISSALGIPMIPVLIYTAVQK